MSKNTDDNARNVWIGCLACYNAGALIGDWFPANEAGEVTVEQVHEGHHGTWRLDTHEELWCFDTENMPVRGEMSPMEAQRIAELCDAIEDDNLPVKAVVEWTLHTGESFSQMEWDAPTRSEFSDAYQGEYDSEEAYVEERLTDEGTAAQLEAIEIGHINAWQYLDLKGVARDWFADTYYSEPAEPDEHGNVTTVYVFVSL